MVTISDIDLSEGEFISETEIDVAAGFLTVQVQYTGIDGDFEVVPLQSNEVASEGPPAVVPSYDPIYDFRGASVKWKIEHRGVSSGSKTFNLLDLKSMAAMVKVRPSGGRFSATEGTVELIIMNS